MKKWNLPKGEGFSEMVRTPNGEPVYDTTKGNRGTDCPAMDKKHHVVILLPRIAPSKNPGFYICFECRRIFQAGVGEVRDSRAS